MKPKFRCGTQQAIEELSKELKLPYDETMQDWSYQVAEPDDIEKYLAHYKLTTNEDKKFVLIEMILQALLEQKIPKQLLYHWEKTSEILTNDFNIHEYTIDYWLRYTKEDFKLYNSLLKKVVKQNKISLKWT